MINIINGLLGITGGKTHPLSMHENDGPSFHSNYPGLHGMVLFFSDSLQLLSYLSSVCSLSLSPAVACSPQDGWFVGNIHHMSLVTIMIMLVMAYF